MASVNFQKANNIFISILGSLFTLKGNSWDNVADWFAEPRNVPPFNGLSPSQYMGILLVHGVATEDFKSAHIDLMVEVDIMLKKHVENKINAENET